MDSVHFLYRARVETRPDGSNSMEEAWRSGGGWGGFLLRLQRWKPLMLGWGYGQVGGNLHLETKCGWLWGAGLSDRGSQNCRGRQEAGMTFGIGESHGGHWSIREWIWAPRSFSTSPKAVSALLPFTSSFHRRCWGAPLRFLMRYFAFHFLALQEVKKASHLTCLLKNTSTLCVFLTLKKCFNYFYIYSRGCEEHQ